MTISKFYLHNATSPTWGANMPTPDHSAWTATQTSSGYTTLRAMGGVHGTSQTSAAATTTATKTTQFTLFRVFVSDPLAAQTVSSGSWVLSAAYSESAAQSNMLPTATIYIWRPSGGGSVVGTILDHTVNGAEPSTTETAVSVTLTGGGSVTCQAGDLLVCEVWASNTQSSATAYTNTFFYDGTTDASTTSNAAFLTAPAPLTLRTETILAGGGTLSATASVIAPPLAPPAPSAVLQAAMRAATW